MANYRTNQKSLIISSNTKRKRLSTLSAVVIVGFLAISLIIPTVYGNGCPVLSEQERCDFTYIMTDPDGVGEDIPITSCRDEFEYPEGSGAEEATEKKDFYCPLNDEFDGTKTWGICNGGCFEDDPENQNPKDFGGPDKATEAIFCKIRSASCQFPFRYENANHSSCIQRGENFWCPTKVNDDLEPIKGFWGKCNVAEGKTNCDPNWTPPPDPEAEPEAEIKTKVAVVKISEDDFESGVSADIKIEEEEGGVIRIKGTVKGLPVTENYTKFGFHIHEKAFENQDCLTAGSHFNPLESKHGEQTSVHGKKDSLLNAIAAAPVKDSHIGDLNNLVADENGEATVDIEFEHNPRPSLFEGDTNILRRTLVIHAGEDDLTPEGDGVGNAGSRIACGLILEPSDEGMGITILIIILVVVAILVVALLICICCYYCKRNNPNEKKPHQTNGIPDPVDSNGYIREKKALFDELSIPFIDASPAPSPKPGRSTDRLSFFHRSSSAVGSRGSLSDEVKC